MSEATQKREGAGSEDNLQCPLGVIFDRSIRFCLPVHVCFAPWSCENEI